MSPIKQRLLEAIERTPESILEQTLTFLEFLISRRQTTAPDFDSDFDSDTDSNDQILADLKASLHQASSEAREVYRRLFGRHSRDAGGGDCDSLDTCKSPVKCRGEKGAGQGRAANDRRA